MKNYLFYFLTASLIWFSSCQTGEPWQPLFNGENIDNWDKYLGSALDGQDSLAQAATVEKVFSVVDENGEKVIRISGEINGALATRDTFSNYHLQLVYKWGDEVFATRNSGLLYHSFGDFGAAFGTWMTNIECQLMHENLGDTYLMNNTYCESTVEEDGDEFRFNASGEPKKFSTEHNGQMVRKRANAENPLGEWNTVDLYCVGRTAVHMVNGEVVMVNTNTGTVEDDGSVKPLTSGKIQLQSEGAELFVRSVKIKPISKIDAELLQ